MLTLENSLLIGSILLFVSILASKTSGRIGIPALLVFLAIGIIAGSEGLGQIHFNDALAAQSLGVIALVVILFSGGLDTKWESVRPVVWQSISLATIGVTATAVSVGLFAMLLLDFTIYEGILLGAIVSSTDAAAVFSILRSKGLGLKGRLRPMLELESGSNDPMAFFLTISFITLITNPGTSIWSLLPSFFVQMIFGGVAGFSMAKGMLYLTNRVKLDYEGLYPVLFLAFIFLVYSITTVIGGNGFLAAYISGLVIGNHEFIHKKSVMKFYDGMAWLMQIIMFITLGLLVFPSNVIQIIGPGILFSLFLIFVARPIGVLLSLSLVRMSLRKKLFVSWVGLRGAVPIIFATYPLLAGIEQSSMIFNIVFFIVITSVILQGTTLPQVAKWLHLYVPEKLKRKFELDIELSEEAKNDLIELEVPPEASSVGRAVVELGFPKRSLIVFIKRGHQYLTPNGSTRIAANDKLMIMTEDKNDVGAILKALGIPQSMING